MATNKELCKRVISLSTDLVALAQAFPGIISEVMEETTSTDQVRRHPVVSFAARSLEQLSKADIGTNLHTALEECESKKNQHRMFQDAVQVQNASNPSGVSRSLARHVEELASAGGDITRHPVIVAFSSKLADLCWTQDPEYEVRRIASSED